MFPYSYFQIKRMLVHQRGFIVESLKRMAAASTTADSSSEPVAAAGMTARKSAAINAEERDRTIGRVVAVQPEQLQQTAADSSSCYQLLSTAVVGQQQLQPVTSCEVANKVSLKLQMKFLITSEI